MYKIILFACGILIGSSAFSFEEEIVKSNITEVTVYAQGAQVRRKALYSIKSGITQVIIEGICPTIDPNSLQVLASGNVVIVDAKYSLFYPKPAPENLEGLPLKVKKEIKILEDSLKRIGFEIQQIQDEIDVYIATKNILANNGAIRGQGKVNDSINLLKQAMDYYTVKMLEINKNLQGLNRAKGAKAEIQAEMNMRLKALKNYQNSAQLNSKPVGPSHRVTVTLSATEAISGRLNLSYLVNQAGWTPLYDMRAEVQGSKINMNYKAQVYQNTGVDWDDVRLSISTNNPYQNKTLPTLHPWYIDYNNYKALPSATRSNNLDIKKQALGYGKNEEAESTQKEYYMNSNGVAYDAKTSADFTQVIEHMISAEFKIDLPYTIKSNNEQHMVLIRNIDIPANYRYYTIPKLDQSAFLMAELANLSDLQLVPAKANIFFDGTYIGETYLNPSQMDDTITFSLGKDPNIIVKRTLMKKECKERIVNNNKEKINAYNIEIRNLKSTNVEIVVLDQMPITTNPEIEIEEQGLDKGTLDPKTGNIEWIVKIKPKDNYNINYKYRVKHNKDLNLYL
ncbi:MAG: mucoidy inhibitor MuiA family protein [Crocinitomicaceae bacterium]